MTRCLPVREGQNTPFRPGLEPLTYSPPPLQLSALTTWPRFVWAHKLGETGLFSAPKLTILCRTPSMSI